MTELEKMERAKMYMEKLANGINPIDDSPVPDGDTVNNVRISRCFFFVSDILEQVIKNGVVISAPNFEKPKKAPFSLTYERRNAFVFSHTPIPVSEIAKRLNDLASGENMKKISTTVITSWLLEAGVLAQTSSPTGRKSKHPTTIGTDLGLEVESRVGLNGEYQVVLYNEQAQHFILDNLDAIIEAENAKTEMQGMPWTLEQDEKLKELLRQGVSMKEMALQLKRNTSAIRGRLRKLGLLDNK